MENQLIQINTQEIQPLFEKSIQNVREDIKENPYLKEALKVLPVGGYRSAIGSFWNAVVDDLRNKIIYRSLELFNKEIKSKKEVKNYEDFQNNINDDELIEGAYKIGVIGWEASKILKHSKETRHIFDGHPKSSDPSIIKVLAMFDDCIKYVLNEPYPPKIIDISEYIQTMSLIDFDRNEIAITNALAELPETYKNELINRIFKAYTIEESSSELRSNIEFTAPILWSVLPKENKNQIVKSLDTIIGESNIKKTNRAFKFIEIVGGYIYLSSSSRNYKIKPLIVGLKENLDNWSEENKYVGKLEKFSPYIPMELLNDYVESITLTYIGHTGHSYQFSRSDFYANQAAPIIQNMFEHFDDNAATAFVEIIKNNSILKSRISNPTKLNRLRSLTSIVLEKISNTFSEKYFLDLLMDSSREKDFFNSLR